MSLSNPTHTPAHVSAPVPAACGDGGALALSALAAVFWGTNFEATRLALIDLPPWTAAAGRFVLAAVISAS